jgi:hypothetical protein
VAPLQITGEKPVQNMYIIHKKQLDLHCRVCGGRAKRARSGRATRQYTCLSQKEGLQSVFGISVEEDDHSTHPTFTHATIPSVSTAHHQSGPFSGWYIKQRVRNDKERWAAGECVLFPRPHQQSCSATYNYISHPSPSTTGISMWSSHMSAVPAARSQVGPHPPLYIV